MESIDSKVSLKATRQAIVVNEAKNVNANDNVFDVALAA